ncbi:hypothetical protein BTVI_09965 [Pitangus sulphuratus]|nr:hypothetical protein BTVI_09965 [Pitangus sulphuratus]
MAENWHQNDGDYVGGYCDMEVIRNPCGTSAGLEYDEKQLEFITPFQLYFNPDLIFRKFQIWRLITNFLFFGPLGFSFFFNMIFLYRYCRMLEEGSFRGRTADFVFMFLFGGFLMTAFTIMLVYVWSRRNPYIRMNFFGLLNFQAPFLPWVLMGFSLLLGNSIIIDLLGRWYLTRLKRIPTITLCLRIVQTTNPEAKTRTSSSIRSNTGDFFMWPDSSLLAGLTLWPRDPTGITPVAIPTCNVSLSVWVTHPPLVPSGSKSFAREK